jgi:hypothetical protein
MNQKRTCSRVSSLVSREENVVVVVPFSSVVSSSSVSTVSTKTCKKEAVLQTLIPRTLRKDVKPEG